MIEPEFDNKRLLLLAFGIICIWLAGMGWQAKLLKDTAVKLGHAKYDNNGTVFYWKERGDK